MFLKCTPLLIRQSRICANGLKTCNHGQKWNTGQLINHRENNFTISKAFVQTSPKEDVSTLQAPKKSFQNSAWDFLDKYVDVTLTEKYRRGDLEEASHVLLNSIYMKVDFAMLQKHAGLNDTFEVWLKIVYLHLWMLLVKLAQHGRDGKIVTKTLVQLLWTDIHARAGKIEDELHQRFEVKKRMKEYSDLLIPSFAIFDYGLLKDDATLAGSIWNMIYSFEIVDPRLIETLVHYVRFNVARLDNVSMDHLVLDAENLTWPIPENFDKFVV